MMRTRFGGRWSYRPWLSVLFVQLCWGSNAEAECFARAELEVSSLEPKDGRPQGIAIQGWADGMPEVTSPAGCSLTIENGMLRPRPGATCDAIFKVDDTLGAPWQRQDITFKAGTKCNGDEDAPARLQIEPPTLAILPAAYTFELVESAPPSMRVRLSKKSSLDRILLLIGPAWQRFDLDAEGTTAVAWHEWLKITPNPGGRTFRGFALGPKDADTGKTEVYELRLARAAPPAICHDEQDKDDSWCDKGDFGNHQRLCFDATHGSLTPVRMPDRSLARPNLGFAVLVRHCANSPVRISLDGERGTVRDALDNRRDPTPAARGKEGGDAGPPEARPPEPVRVAVRTFGPRLPGTTDLKLAVGADATPETYELSVVKKDLGALRLGLGLALGEDAVPPAYEAKIPAGASTPVVTQTSGGRAAAELVMGVSPFILDYLKWGGRSYENNDTWFIAPFVGFGVLSATAQGIDAFRSFHLGIEFEPIRQLSIAATWVIRRVDRLAGGLTEGSPLAGDSITTRSDWGTGFGIVINATPDVFRFAAHSEGSQGGTKPTPPNTGTEPSEPTGGKP
ncbi:MAG TPA: hypothetical protein VNN80_19555 [Polyangiaceae bacterium]|nr:hypothetical protein [Polyangiaceae bacterium]